LSAIGFNQSKKEALLARREKVWQLRVIDRLPYREIAKRLNTTVYTVHMDAKWISDNIVKNLKGKQESLVATQNEIYEALLNKWLPVALGSPSGVYDKDGEPVGVSHEDQLAATDRIVKVLQDQAKLFGFNTLPKSTGEARELGHGIAEGVIEAMARFAGKTQAKVIEAQVIDEQPRIQNVNEASEAS
jgi:hypothetical protein